LPKLTTLNRTVNVVLNLQASFSGTELSKPCILRLTNMHTKAQKKERTKEASEWMTHPKHRISYNYKVKKYFLFNLQINLYL
jgi:hypothetical protein